MSAVGFGFRPLPLSARSALWRSPTETSAREAEESFIPAAFAADLTTATNSSEEKRPDEAANSTAPRNPFLDRARKALAFPKPVQAPWYPSAADIIPAMRTLLVSLPLRATVVTVVETVGTVVVFFILCLWIMAKLPSSTL